MSSILNNFVTVRKNKGDVLNPAQFRSIVEMILGVLKQYDFVEVFRNQRLLLEHVLNYDDPHHDHKIPFLGAVVEQTYAIYTNMLPNPLSLADFKTQIVPTLGFLELIRRIVLNRYLYNQVKLSNGSVPNTATALLTADWLHDGPGATSVNLTFGYGIGTEIDFIRKGWNTNTAPVPTIFNALGLIDASIKLPVIFGTSSAAPYIADNGTDSNYTAPLNTGSNDLTIRFKLIDKPTVATVVASLRNGVDLLKITVNPDRSVVMTVNNQIVAQTNGPISGGDVEVAITRLGYFSFQTVQNNIVTKDTNVYFLNQDTPFNQLQVGSGLESLVYPGYGLRNLEINRGYTLPAPVIDFTVPDGYVILMDEDGAYLFDPDGAPLMDYDITPPAGMALLVDNDGYFIKDDTSDAFLVEPV